MGSDLSKVTNKGLVSKDILRVEAGSKLDGY